MQALSLPVTLFRYRLGMGLLYALFTLPILVPYYATKGIDASGYFFIEALFRITYFGISFFTGPISDHGSRKACLLGGTACWWLGSLVIFLGQNFWVVAAGEMLLAGGMAFFVSSGRAYLYDVMLSYNEEKNYSRALSFQRGLENGARMLAMVAGGFLFMIWAEIPQICSLVATSIAFGVFLYIPEPARHKPLEEKPASLPALIKNLGRLVRTYPGLINIQLYSASLTSVTALTFWGVQPVLRQTGLSVLYIGLALAASTGITALVLTQAHGIIKGLSLKKSITLLWPLALCELIALTFVHQSIILLVLILNSFIFALAQVAFESLVQHQVDSSVRATAISLGLICDMVLSALVLSGMGLLLKSGNLTFAFGMMALVLGGLSLAFLTLLWRVFPKLKVAE